MILSGLQVLALPEGPNRGDTQASVSSTLPCSAGFLHPLPARLTSLLNVLCQAHTPV